MKLNFKVLSALLSAPLLVLAADPAQIQKVSGTVEFKAAQGATWSQAQPGTAVPSGGRVRTGNDGRAELKFHNKTSVWLKPATSIAVDQKGPKNHVIALESGSLKIRVPHLKFREKFEVKTPIAVASVRGTVFSIDDKKVQTFFGDVKMHLNDGKVVDVPQGMGFGDNQMATLSQVEESLGLEDWSPGLSDDERQKGLAEFVENRQQIRDYAHDALARNQELIDNLAANVKDADFAAGRTLVDVHGNLVRVEQRLERPAADTIQVMNIVLRQSYAGATNFRNYTYSGPTTSRVDALIAKVQFNQALPEQINSFPGFFGSHDVKADHTSMIAANLENPGQIATIAFLGTRQSLTTPGASDDVKPDLYVGDVNGRPTLFALNTSNAVASGLTHYTDANANMINIPGTGGELYSSTARRFTKVSGGGSGAQDVWVCTENFGIDNGGHVRNTSDYTSGGANVLDLLGNSAAESVIFVKNQPVGLPSAPTSASQLNGYANTFAGGRNIDLVVIPDLFLSIVKSLATSADAFKTTY